VRLLLVEDRPETVEAISTAAAGLGGDVELAVAGSRESAMQLLESTSFDLIICDLRIPPTDPSLEADIVHGELVYRRARELFPGTPILLFTAYGTIELAQAVIDEHASADCFGTGADQPVVTLRTKDQLDEALSMVEDVVAHVRALSAIELGGGGHDVGLSEDEARVLRIYARRVGGRVVRAAPVGGGLSGARTFRVEAKTSAGELAALVIAKLGQIPSIEDERQRFETLVAPRLPQAAFPHLTGIVRAGAGPEGGLFYGLAADFTRSLFELMVEDAGAAALVVGQVADYLSRWTDGRSPVERTVGSMRRDLVSDEVFAELRSQLDEVEIDRVEAMPCHANACVQHGDLHGENILVSDSNRAIVIDFGSVFDAWASLDPITLELSSVFHPAGAKVRGSWPTHEQAGDWADLESYLKGCPIEKFIRACREWAWAMSNGDREFYATSYSYALRQLQYGDVDSDLAKAVATGVAAKLLQT
jgi:CheY-like chemotaxis protein